MKKLFIVSFAFVITSCGAFIRSTTGTTAAAAKKQASVEYGCPIEKIILLEKTTRTGNSTYALDVCGTRRVYTQIGSTLQEKK